MRVHRLEGWTKTSHRILSEVESLRKKVGGKKARARQTETKGRLGFFSPLCLALVFVTIPYIAVYAPQDVGAQAPIRFGNVVAISGPMGAAGQAGPKVLELYAEDINKRGGILGRPVEVLTRDDEGLPADAIKAIRELHDRYGVNFFLNMSASAAAIAAVPVLQELGALGIVGAVSDQIVGSKGGANVFRFSGGSYLQNRGFVDIVREKYPNAKKWANISQDYSLSD